jgi:hypothetical protein
VTKRRRRLLGLLALTALVGVLAVPAVHWRLIGWWWGEPFWQGRPASYWRAEVADSELLLAWSGRRMATNGFPAAPPLILLARRSGPLDPVLRWLADQLDRPELASLYHSPFLNRDASAVPVLTALLRDPEPKVRLYAVHSLAYLGEAARPAWPALRGMAGDRAEVGREITVADIVSFALEQIDYAAWEAAGRP